MKVLILGASGFLGGWIYKLIKPTLGKDVIGTGNSNINNSDYIKFDVYNEDDLQTIINYKPDVIAWCLMAGKKENKLIHTGLKNLIRLIAKDCKLIYVSTDAYGEGKGNYREEDDPSYIGASNPLSVYANAKIDGERIVRELSSYVIVRTGPIYGQYTSGKWDGRISTLINTITVGKVYTRTANIYKTFVRVEQLAKAIVELIQLDYQGVLHLGPPMKESYYSFSVRMARELDLDEHLIILEKMNDEEALKKSIPLDTSLNTEKCRKTLKTTFS